MGHRERVSHASATARELPPAAIPFRLLQSLDGRETEAENVRAAPWPRPMPPTVPPPSLARLQPRPSSPPPPQASSPRVHACWPPPCTPPVPKPWRREPTCQAMPPSSLTWALGQQEPCPATPRQRFIPPRPSWEALNSSFIHSTDTYPLSPQQHTRWGALCGKVPLSQSRWRGAGRARARWEEVTPLPTQSLWQGRPPARGSCPDEEWTSCLPHANASEQHR